MIYQPYVYHVLDTTNNMYYIGSKTATGTTPENTKNYYGTPSCHIYKEAIKTRPETLVKTVIAVCQTAADVIAFEARLHAGLNVACDPMSYNKANQTSSGFSKAGVPQSEEHKAKILATKSIRPLSEEARSKMAAAAQNKRSDETKAKMSAAKKGIPLSAEHRAKMSAAHQKRNELKRLQAATG